MNGEENTWPSASDRAAIADANAEKAERQALERVARAAVRWRKGIWFHEMEGEAEGVLWDAVNDLPAALRERLECEDA